MQFSPLFGIILALVVFLGTAITSTSQSRVFLDPHAFFIVIGGTLSATLIGFSAKTIFSLLKVFFKRVLGKNDDMEKAFYELVDLSRGYRENENYLKEKVGSIKTHFLKDAIQMLLDGGIDPQEIDKILHKRAVIIHQRHEEDADIFKTLAKFPPAFGLLGAVIGMISLMQNLGSADAFKKVGPSMAVALVATMYGIAVANFIFLPIGENLSKLNRFDVIVRSMVIDGIKLIRQKKHPLVVEETLKSYMLPNDRKKLRKSA